MEYEKLVTMTTEELLADLKKLVILNSQSEEKERSETIKEIEDEIIARANNKRFDENRPLGRDKGIGNSPLV